MADKDEFREPVWGEPLEEEMEMYDDNDLNFTKTADLWALSPQEVLIKEASKAKI